MRAMENLQKNICILKYERKVNTQELVFSLPLTNSQTQSKNWLHFNSRIATKYLICLRKLFPETKHALPPRRPGFKSGSGHVGFSMDKVALGHFQPVSFMSFLELIFTLIITGGTSVVSIFIMALQLFVWP
jgi:hypothetical protein